MKGRATFDRLADAVSGAANLEGYRDASPDEIDKAARKLRGAFLTFCRLKIVREAWGATWVDEAAAKIRREGEPHCENCGAHEDECRCDDGPSSFSDAGARAESEVQ